MSRAHFGIDGGCETYTTLTATSTEEEKKKERKDKDRKRKGACDPASREDCGLCTQDTSNFIYRPSTTKRGHPINLMHQCRAICETTKFRCRRHIWENDNPGWNNEYKQPLWCQQHAYMCANPSMGHKNWYKNVCDKDGLKQPDLQFMNSWIESQTPNKGLNRGKKYYDIIGINSKKLAQNIEDEFWYKVYGRSSTLMPDANDINKAYRDPKYLYLITKYFVYLEECANRRNRNNHICFSGEYDVQHDSYLRAIDVMVDAMKQRMHEVKSELPKVRAFLLSDMRDRYTKYLRQQEPRVNNIQETSHDIIFDSKDWGEPVIVTYRTLADLEKLNSVAPHLYTYLHPTLEYLEHNIELPHIATENTIVTSSGKKKLIPTNTKDFEKSIRHILSTGSILANDRKYPSVWSLLTFMDYWNIGVVDSEAIEIMRNMVATFPISTTMEMLNLAQEQGTNFFLKKHMRSIIREILDSQLTSIIKNYTDRLKKTRNSAESAYLTKSIEGFQKRVDNIEKYLDQVDIISKENFKSLAELNDSLENNKIVISDIANKISKHKK